MRFARFPAGTPAKGCASAHRPQAVQHELFSLPPLDSDHPGHARASQAAVGTVTAAGAAAAAAALAASAEGAGPAPSGPCYRSALQQLLIDVFTDDDPGQRLLLLSAMVPAAHQAAWHLVVHTLWARRLDLGSPTHARQAADAHTRAWMLSRQWDQPVLQQRWQRLIGGMGESLCRRLVSRARRQWRSAMALH